MCIDINGYIEESWAGVLLEYIDQQHACEKMVVHTSEQSYLKGAGNKVQIPLLCAAGGKKKEGTSSGTRSSTH